jgi:L-threonylcarbamoyladenylate synthase
VVKKKYDPDAEKTVLSVLRSGGIVILPCDTIYGIVGRCSDTEERIRAIKGRGDKPFIRLIPSVKAVSYYTDYLPSKVILSLWPGPLTLIVAHKSGGTVALRVPDDPFLIAVLEKLSAHLFSTSVNITGEAALWKIEEIIETFGGRVDLILDDGDLPGKKPSTVLDVSGKSYRILRQGACIIPPELLE